VVGLKVLPRSLHSAAGPANYGAQENVGRSGRDDGKAKARRRRKAAPTLAGLAEGVDPGHQHVAEVRFKIEEFDAHADTRLDDADGDESFEDLAFASELHAGTGVHGKRFAGTDETSAQGNIRSDTIHLLAGFEVDEFNVAGEGKTDGIAAVTNSRDTGIRRVRVGHGDDFAHFTHLK
jgi:hypothetical protein